MLTLEDRPRRQQDLAMQCELLKTQLATLRAVHIAVVGPACILVTAKAATLRPCHPLPLVIGSDAIFVWWTLNFVDERAAARELVI